MSLQDLLRGGPMPSPPREASGYAGESFSPSAAFPPAAAPSPSTSLPWGHVMGSHASPPPMYSLPGVAARSISPNPGLPFTTAVTAAMPVPHQDVNNNSPPTSPPSSVAPAYSDDEFTANLLRMAASRLGLDDYTPAHGLGATTPTVKPGGFHSGRYVYAQAPLGGNVVSGGYVGGRISPATTSPPHSRSASALLPAQQTRPIHSHPLLLAMERTQQLPFPGPHTWAAYGAATCDDLMQMVDVRCRALGPRHRSITTLYDAIGDRYVLEGHFAKAEQYYTAAFHRMTGEDPGTVLVDRPSSDAITLQEWPEEKEQYSVGLQASMAAKLGGFFAERGKWTQAREMFVRAADLAHAGNAESNSFAGALNAEEAHNELAARYSDGKEKSSPQAAEQQLARERLRNVLKEARVSESLQDSRSTSPSALVSQQQRRRDLATALLATISAAAVTKQAPLNSASEHMPSVGMAPAPVVPTESIEIQTESHPGLGLPPPPPFLTAEQVQRLRAPTLRSMHDLKALVSYVKGADPDESHFTPADHTASPVAAATAETIRAIRSRLNVADAKSMRRPIQSAVMNSAPETPAHHSGHIAESERRLSTLKETIRKVREDHGIAAGDSVGSYIAGGGMMTTEAATEREVARMLLEASAVSSNYSPSPDR